MACNFIDCDRDRLFLLPPLIREWLPEWHLVWFILDAVEEVALSGLYPRYRQDGWGAAYMPEMMVALLFCTYCVRIRFPPDRASLYTERDVLKAITGGKDQTTHHYLGPQCL